MIYQIQLISKATFREPAAFRTGNIVLCRDDISKDSLQVAMVGTGQLRLDQWETCVPEKYRRWVQHASAQQCFGTVRYWEEGYSDTELWENQSV